MHRMQLMVWFSLCACGPNVGPKEIHYPVVGVGGESTFDVQGWTVTLDIAEIGFGPAYFCATAAASSDLCPTAISQMAYSAVINGLAVQPHALGVADGETGVIRSAQYDFALTWFTTERQPTPMVNAPRGHSAYFEGRAVNGGQTLQFRANVDLSPSAQGTRAIQGARAQANLIDDRILLSVKVTPSAWWKNVDFDQLAQGGAASVEILPGAPAYEAIAVSMMTLTPPELTWTHDI